MSKHEFLSLTFREFHALRSRHKYRNQWQELLFAQTTAMVGNTAFRGFDEPLKHADFMPSQWNRKQRKPQAKQAIPITNDQRIAVVSGLSALFIGNITRPTQNG